MSCPYKFHDFTVNDDWMCNLAHQKCPECYLMWFDFKECSTYKEEENKI